MHGYIIVLIFFLIDGILSSLFYFIFCPVVHMNGVWDLEFSDSDPYSSHDWSSLSHFLVKIKPLLVLV